MSSTEPRTPAPRDPDDETGTSASTSDVAGTTATSTGGPTGGTTDAPVVSTSDATSTGAAGVPSAGTDAADDDAAPVPATRPVERTVLTVDDDDEDDLTDEEEDDDAYLSDDDDRALAGAGLGSRLGVEALGTFALVIVITGVVLFRPISQVDALGVALAAGLVLTGVVAAFGHLSGGHFNPAVTLGTAVAGLTRWVDVPLYWLAQLVGAAAAAVTVFLIIPETLPQALGIEDVPTFFATTANSWGESSPMWLASGELTAFDQRSAFVVELIAAAVLTAVVLGTARRRWSFSPAPAAVGLTYAALFLLTSPVTGGSANPARSTAAAIFSGGEALGQLWLFWVAPLLGALLAGLAYFGFGRGGSPRAGETVDDVVAVPPR